MSARGPGPGSLESFLRAARAAVGPEQVLTASDAVASYTEDWTHRWSGKASAVVRPGSTAEVGELMREARRHRIALVPQGGNTGLVGGSVPHAGEVVVSLRRMDEIGPVDMLAGQVTVGAGALLSSLQERATSSGLAFGVDLAARGSATIGGMVATNAGGLHVVRHGPMRSQLVGIEAVLGNGHIVSRLSGLVKDNTGYDLAQLLCGSEGTLGIVTRARLKLVPGNRELVVALLALGSLPAAVELAGELRRRLAGVQALELMTADSLRLVVQHLGVTPPVRVDAEVGAFLLVEVEGAEDPTESLASALDPDGVRGAEPRDAALLDSAVATTEADRARLWWLRERHSDVAVDLATARRRVVHKLDVTLPAAALAEFCHDVASLVEKHWPGSVVLLFGHVGDGNVHVNVVGPADEGGRDPGRDGSDGEIDDAVMGLVVERGGSISAEHGIGVAKKPWLARNRSSGEVAAMQAVKVALDPDGILNPNVLLPGAAD